MWVTNCAPRTLIDAIMKQYGTAVGLQASVSLQASVLRAAPCGLAGE